MPTVRTTADPRKAPGARQLRARVKAEETHCGICGGEVDKSLTVLWNQHGTRCKGDGCAGCVPHPMRGEVDEIVPVSKGGSTTDRGNRQLVHRVCNSRKGDKLAAPEPMAAELFPLSDCWGGMFDSLRGGGDPPPHPSPVHPWA